MENTSQTFDKKSVTGKTQSESGQTEADLSLKAKPLVKRWYRPTSFSEYLNLGFWAILFLALVPHTIYFLVHSFEVIVWPYQVDYDEGLNLITSWHLAQ